MVDEIGASIPGRYCSGRVQDEAILLGMVLQLASNCNSVRETAQAIVRFA